jgi:hypothetical protein
MMHFFGPYQRGLARGRLIVHLVLQRGGRRGLLRRRRVAPRRVAALRAARGVLLGVLSKFQIEKENESSSSNVIFKRCK